jgi:hypothetical protein
MQLLGQPGARLLAAWTALGALAALLPAAWMWGFTVDDALIAVRYASHVATGVGWRFNPHGPSTDGVTPLPWPIVLAPLARADPLVVLVRAKLVGLVIWVATGAALGRAVGRAVGTAKTHVWAGAAALATLALSVPVAAHSVSGMETSLATALATFAALLVARPRVAALLSGLAAALRPEMAPWACALALGATIAARRPARECLLGVGLALAPFVTCAIVRELAWGRPAPLALLAKPSDVAHGLAYAGAGCVVTLVPILVLAPVALARNPPALAIVVAAVVHFVAVIVVGGDWMPYARLLVPVVPSLAYAAALASSTARGSATAVRSVAAIALGVWLVARGGTSGRHVGDDRTALVHAAQRELAGADRVAALDIGWVGASTEADVVDLAGLTDPEIAALPGGHTSKRIGAMYLLARAPDVLLIYVPRGLPPDGLDGWRDAIASRAVEAHFQEDEVIARHFAPTAWLPLGSDGAGYVVLRRR